MTNHSMRITAFASVLALSAFMPLPLCAEIFLLKNGGKIEGELLNPEEKPRDTYKIRTAAGVELSLAREQVKDASTPRPAELEYARRRPETPDTVKDQFEFALWCRDNKLMDERERHLRRVIALEPDHITARRMLGYRSTKEGWKTEAEIHEARGEVYVKGKWRTPQEAELLEQSAEATAAVKEWHKSIDLWRSWLRSDRQEEAVRLLLQVQNPLAIEAVLKAIDEDPDYRVRKVFVDVLAQINTPRSQQALARLSLFDEDPELRINCLEILKQNVSPSLVKFFCGFLTSKHDNEVINRAGVALGELNDPSAVDPLINALVTTHKYVDNSNPNQNTYTFTPPGQPGLPGGGGGGGFNFGGGPKIHNVDVNNPGVHDALLSLTGMDFEYNEPAWRRWYVTQKSLPNLDARRDGQLDARRDGK